MSDEMPKLEPLQIKNATFFAFKTGGSHKWAYSGRGYLSRDVFGVHTVAERREQMLRDNGGLFPGMSGRADDYALVIIGDEELEYGWPLMFYPDNVP